MLDGDRSDVPLGVDVQRYRSPQENRDALYSPLYRATHRWNVLCDTWAMRCPKTVRTKDDRRY